jgi:hypothetical protein
MVRTLLAVTAALLLLPAAAEAHPFRSLFGPRTTTAYSYPAPVVYYAPAVVTYPCPVPVAPAVVVPAAPARPLATPQPAPPSRSPEPPLSPPAPGNPPAPQVGEMRYYDGYGAAGRAGARTPDRCSVAFWNLSDRDLTVLVAGQSVSLPRGRSVQMELDRQFTWQIDGRPAVSERIPANESAWDILIRR